MTNSSTERQPDSIPPLALLWARELRRENVHLVNELDTTKSNLDSTMSSVATLEQTLTVLDETVKKFQAATETQVSDIYTKANSRILEFVACIEDTKKENGLLWEKLETANRECEERVQKTLAERWEVLMEKVGERSLGQMAQRTDEVKAQVREDLGRMMTGDQASKEKALVPDSMPTQRGLTLNQRDRMCLRTLSQSTLGSSSSGSSRRPSLSLEQLRQQRALVLVRHRVRRDPEPIEPIFFKQGKESIYEYFKIFCVRRAELLPSERESKAVELFLAGMEDVTKRFLIEDRLDQEGWTWEALTGIIRDVVYPLRKLRKLQRTGSNGFQRVNQGQGQGYGQDRAASNHPGPGGRIRARPKRHIPIVPADEEDITNSK